MNKKFLILSVIGTMICLGVVSCKKTPINDSILDDDSFLEGEWLCPEIITQSDSAGNISRICIGAGGMDFDIKKKQVYIDDGCNSSTADYSLWSDSVLTCHGDGMWTELYCQCHASWGGEGKIRRFVEDDTEGIELDNGVSKTLLIRPGRWFLRGDWDLAFLQNEDIQVSDITVSFNLMKNLVTLSEPGVATYSLPFSTGPNCSISFDITALKDLSTKLNNTWRQLPDLLKETTHYEISAGGCSCVIIFYNKSDNFLFKLIRVDEEAEQRESKFPS